MSFAVGLGVVAAVVWLLAGPLLRGVRDMPEELRARGAEARSAAGLRREILLRQLSELEYDYRMGKLTADEYRHQRSSLAG